MHINERRTIRPLRNLIVALGLVGVFGAVGAAPGLAQTNDLVFMGPCQTTGYTIEGQCPVSTTDTVSGLNLLTTRTVGLLVSDMDTLYFDQPHPNAEVKVTVTVRSGVPLDLVNVGSPDPAPNTYALKYQLSRGPKTIHEVLKTGPKGRWRINVGSNYLSGPGLTVYDVTVEVKPVLAAPIPLTPRFKANQCQPPMDLGTVSSGGGVANTKLRSGIELRPGDFDCYEFDLQYSGPKFSSLFGNVWMRFVLDDLPNTGTTFLFLFDATRGGFPQTWSTTQTSMTQYTLLPPGRYRMYVIGGRDGFTSSSYGWRFNTY